MTIQSDLIREAAKLKGNPNVVALMREAAAELDTLQQRENDIYAFLQTTRAVHPHPIAAVEFALERDTK